MEPTGKPPADPLRQIAHLADSDAPVKFRAPGIPSGTGLGKYRILERIRTYHNAAVYKARDAMLDRLVVVKQMSPELIDSPVACGNFKREAQLLARIPKDSRNLVNIHELIEDEIGLFIVEEFIPGQWLESLIFKRHVDHKSAYKLLKTAAIGLRTLHENMIVHRDIHPGNIMVTRGGAAKIANLGSAAHEGDLTPPPVITPKYAAPELLLERKYDNRVDIYGLGFVFYEVCVGRAALERHFAAMLAEPMAAVGGWIQWHTNFNEHLPEASELNPLVPPGLSAILRRMTAKDLEKRYTSIGEVLEDLSRYVSQRRPEESSRGHVPSYLSDAGPSPWASPRLLPAPDDSARADAHDAYTRPRTRPITSTHTVRSLSGTPGEDPMWRWQGETADSWNPSPRSVRYGRPPRRGSRPGVAPAPMRVISIPPPPPHAEPIHRRPKGHILAWTLTFLMMMCFVGAGGGAIWYYQFGPGFSHPINGVVNEAMQLYDDGKFDECLAKIKEAKRMDVTRSDLVTLQGRLDFWVDLIRAQKALDSNKFAEVERILKQAGLKGVNPSKVDELEQKLWTKRDAQRLAQEGLDDLAEGKLGAVEMKLDEYATKASAVGMDPGKLKDSLDTTKSDIRYDESIREAARLLSKEHFEDALTACETAEAIRVTSTTREVRRQIENAKKRRDWMNRADQAMLEKDYTDAEASYTEAIRLGPSPELEMKARYARAYLLMEEARELIAQGDLLNGEQKLKSSLWNAYTQEGRARLERMAPAFEAARKARAADRAFERGDDAEAIKLYEEALPDLPSPADSRAKSKVEAAKRRQLIQQGDDALNRGDKQAALSAYNAAKDLRGGSDIEMRIRQASKPGAENPPVVSPE